ncbi:MAG: glycosyltransferase family 2 protein [Clostridiales bacterium]|nr:glycosyltransferase family 2 protein [Clostridiales bacterium]
MEPVRVSIVVPVYNTGNYLKKCVDSILSQTCGDFELILVDDGSTDDSPAICDRCSQADGRIRVIHKENGGLSSARNAGLELARGKYICFVDSDDYVSPDLLETVVPVMEENGCDWVAFGMVKEDPAGALIEKIGFKPCRVRISSEEERMNFLLEYLLNYRLGWEAWSHVFRGDLIREHHLRFVSEREIFAEDMLFSFTYWMYAHSCVVLDKQPYHYIQREESLMGESKKRNVLPQIHRLAQQAYRAALDAGQTYIQDHFEILYWHFLEWQTRPYVARHGIGWVRETMAQLEPPAFLPRESSALRRVYLERVKQFGRLDGFATVAVPVSSEAEAARAEVYVRRLLAEQTLQKLDVLILSPRELPLTCDDARVRQVCLSSFEKGDLIRAAFRESWGAYLYFADPGESLPARFLEQACDTLKYSYCSAVFFREPPLGFFDMGVPEHRLRLRRLLRAKAVPVRSGVFRSDLLEESGLSCMEELQEYVPDIILSGHAMVIQGE